MTYGMGSQQMYDTGRQLNAEVGYGLPAGRPPRGDAGRRVDVPAAAAHANPSTPPPDGASATWR